MFFLGFMEKTGFWGGFAGLAIPQIQGDSRCMVPVALHFL
jgi:hypothetical protein